MNIVPASLLLAFAVLVQESKCMPPKSGKGGKGPANTGPLLKVAMQHNQYVNMVESNLRVVEMLPAWWHGIPENEFNVYDVFIYRPIKEMSYSGKLNYVIHPTADRPKSAELILGAEKFVPLSDFVVCQNGKTPFWLIGIDRIYITIPKTKTVLVQAIIEESQKREAEEFEALEGKRRRSNPGSPKSFEFNPLGRKL